MGRKRDPDSALSQLDRYIADHPGSLSNEIADGMGLDHRVVVKRLASLRNMHRIRREGELHAYRYFPGLNQPGTAPNLCPCCGLKRPAVDDDGHCTTCHDKIQKYIDGFNEGYEQGYADALAGKPKDIA